MVTRTLDEYREGEHLSFSVILRSEDGRIGRVGPRGLDWKWHNAERLVYWIDPEGWNRGYATEVPDPSAVPKATSSKEARVYG